MRTLALSAILLLAAVSARAEIAVFANGSTMKIDSHRVVEGQALLALRGGGQMEMALAEFEGFVPDEVFEEIFREAPAGAGPEAIRALARKVAKRHGLNADLVFAMIAVESNYEPQAVSPKGARGLMQLMPSTAAHLGVADAFDPEQNVDGGSRYLKQLLDLYGGDTTKALAAYNAGPGAVQRHGGVPPYKETRAYVKRVLKQAGAGSKKGQ
jgi:soluble lytic murein transglycosylase-like protein